MWSFVVLFLSCVCVCDLFLFDTKELGDVRLGVWGVVLVVCVCVSVSGVLFSVGVCVCVCVCVTCFSLTRKGKLTRAVPPSLPGNLCGRTHTLHNYSLVTWLVTPFELVSIHRLVISK